jgi:hypothetical protein
MYAEFLLALINVSNFKIKEMFAILFVFGTLFTNELRNKNSDLSTTDISYLSICIQQLLSCHNTSTHASSLVVIKTTLN